MAGKHTRAPTPTAITLHRQSRQLELAFDDGQQFRLPFELLRVYSPSAEVRGHGAGQEVLQVGKRDVDILELQPVGQYAIRPVFSDGHSSGLYSWDYLYSLGQHQEPLWQQYLEKLTAAGASRDPDASQPETASRAGSGCSNKH